MQSSKLATQKKQSTQKRRHFLPPPTLYKGAVTLAIFACNICNYLPSEIFEIILDQSKAREMQILYANIANVTAH